MRRLGAATEVEMKEKKARVEDALQNAASAAGLILTTDAMVAELPKDEKPMPGGHGHGMGDMDY